MPTQVTRQAVRVARVAAPQLRIAHGILFLYKDFSHRDIHVGHVGLFVTALGGTIGFGHELSQHGSREQVNHSGSGVLVL